MVEGREVALHEVEVMGAPGNVVAIYKKTAVDGPFVGLPTRLISWGVFGDSGRFKCLVPDTITDVLVGTYDPCMAAHFEKYGHINTENS